MRTPVLLFLALTALATPAAEATGEAVAVDLADAPFSIKCKLSSRDGKETGKLRRIDVSIDGQSTQALKDGGIRLTVTITNKGSDAALIENPLDYLTYILRNGAGEMISQPRPPPRGEILSLKETTPREPRKLPFTLTAMLLNEKKLTDAEINEDTLTLPPSSSLSLQLLIDKAAQAPYAKPESAVIVPLAPGRYALALRVAVLLHREDGSAWFDSPGFSDPACIRVKVK